MDGFCNISNHLHSRSLVCTCSIRHIEYLTEYRSANSPFQSSTMILEQIFVVYCLQNNFLWMCLPCCLLKFTLGFSDSCLVYVEICSPIISHNLDDLIWQGVLTQDVVCQFYSKSMQLCVV